MKGLSGFCFLLGISMVANAFTGHWALNARDVGASWVVLDLVVAAAFFIASMILWNMAKRRELRALIHQHGSVEEALQHFDPSR